MAQKLPKSLKVQIDDWKQNGKHSDDERLSFYKRIVDDNPKFVSSVRGALYGSNANPEAKPHSVIAPPLRAYFRGSAVPEWLLETGREFKALWNECAASLDLLRGEIRQEYRDAFQALDRDFIKNGSLTITVSVEKNKEHRTRTWNDTNAEALYEKEISKIHKKINKIKRLRERLALIVSKLKDKKPTVWSAEFSPSTILQVADRLTINSRKKEKGDEVSNFADWAFSGCQVVVNEDSGFVFRGTNGKDESVNSSYITVSEPLNPENHNRRKREDRKKGQLRLVTLTVPKTNKERQVNFLVRFDYRVYGKSMVGCKVRSKIQPSTGKIVWHFIPTLRYTPVVSYNHGMVGCDPGYRSIKSGEQYKILTTWDGQEYRTYEAVIKDSHWVRKFNRNHPELEIHANLNSLADYQSLTDNLKNTVKDIPASGVKAYLDTLIVNREKAYKTVRRKLTEELQRQYRVIAQDLIQYKAVRYEDTDWKGIAESNNSGTNEERRRQNISRRNRQFLALGTLRKLIENACTKNGIEFSAVPAPETTRRCNSCGHLNTKTAEEYVICGCCGNRYNRDENASKNMYEKGVEIESDSQHLEAVAV